MLHESRFMENFFLSWKALASPTQGTVSYARAAVIGCIYALFGHETWRRYAIPATV